MAKDIAKQTVKPIDDYLKFLQQNFNTSDVSFTDITKHLNSYAKSRQPYYQEAAKLNQQLNNITLLKDPGKYNKFNKLGNFGLGSSGLTEVYVAADDIIKDINVARNWIDSYKRFSSLTSTLSSKTLHSELLVLGKSILGRALEMCPKNTGYLRSTGVLIDFGTYIIIAFLAPYATYVHDNTAIKHPYHPYNCGGTSKFLEKALQEYFPDRSVWVENLGKGEVAVKIGINPWLIEYTHYGS